MRDSTEHNQPNEKRLCFQRSKFSAGASVQAKSIERWSEGSVAHMDCLSLQCHVKKPSFGNGTLWTKRGAECLLSGGLAGLAGTSHSVSILEVPMDTVARLCSLGPRLPSQPGAVKTRRDARTKLLPVSRGLQTHPSLAGATAKKTLRWAAPRPEDPGEGPADSLLCPARHQEDVLHVMDSLLEGAADAVLVFPELEEGLLLLVQRLDHAGAVPHQSLVVQFQLR